MKPACPIWPNKRPFPLTDHCYRAGFGEWRGFFSPDNGDESEFRRFHNFSREFLIESARERAREMAVFALVVAASVWPIIYMIITVVKLLQKGRPLTE